MNDALRVAIEEFRVMHAQILERARRQQHVISTGAILGAAVLTFVAANLVPRASNTVNYELISYVLLLLTFPFYALSLAYAYEDYMIGITASFLHKELRRDICDLAKNKNLLKNEIYFAVKRSEKIIIGWFSFQLVLFIFPVSMLLSYGLLILVSPFKPKNDYLSIQIILLILNIISLIITFVISRKGEHTIREAGKTERQKTGNKKAKSPKIIIHKH